MAKKEKEEIVSELLEIEGLGATSVEKLAQAGITTMMALAVENPKNLAVTAGVSEASARKFIQGARDSLKLGFEKGSSFEKKRNDILKISTGCSNFDDMLAGGIESGCITEVYGSFGVGKTQLAHLMVVRALLEDKDNKAIYIDSENTFRADRIRDFATANGIDPDEALNRIYVTRAFNSDHQMLLLEEAERLIQKEKGFRIIIIDSLTSHFRSEFIGRGTLADRQQKLNQHMHKLLKIADMYNLVALVTNQVMSSPAQMFGDPTKPIGGHIVGHNSTFRIYLRPGKGGTIHADLTDSPNLPNAECNYFVKKEGFENAE